MPRWLAQRATARRRHPDVVAVTVASEDRVPYQALIAVLDTCLGHGFDGIVVDGIDS